MSRKFEPLNVKRNNLLLSKQIKTKQLEEDQLVYKAFPNINLNDFYYEIVTQNTSHFISI